MKKNTYIILLVGIFALLPTRSFANEARLYTLSGFLEVLMDRGLIATEKAPLAQELIEILDARELFESEPEDVSVRASQRIEHADLTFNTFEDVQGLVLVVENTSENSVQLHTSYACPVTYRIYEDKKMLFDSSTLDRCASSKQATYTLGGGESRMFEVTHKRDDYSLSKGKYRFVLQHGSFGSGELEVTIE